MSATALAVLTKNMATRFELGEANSQELMATLKATAFKGQVTDAQMTALMLVAQQYQLNPWTREIYAFPDKNNGIVPVIGVDGWSRIVNDHPQFDGVEFDQTDDSCTCIMYRKDRSHPIKITEYMGECRRQGVGPWQSHPKRMLRHKALIQCARLAFGFTGIFDQDEAERIIEGEKVINPTHATQAPPIAQVLAAIPGMAIKDFAGIDVKGFSEDEKRQVRAACAERKKAVLASQVVADIAPEPAKADETDWLALVANAQSQDELAAIFNAMPNDAQAQLNDAVDERMDYLGSANA